MADDLRYLTAARRLHDATAAPCQAIGWFSLVPAVVGIGWPSASAPMAALWLACAIVSIAPLPVIGVLLRLHRRGVPR